MKRATALVLLLGCRPDLGDRPSRVDGPRIVAVRVEPAEAAPGEVVRATALIVSRDPLGGESRVRWAPCAIPKSFADPAVVSPLCLTTPPTAEGTTVDLTVPADACALFGPEPVSGARPRDADPTGGYFVPLRATLDGESSFHLERVSCAPRDMGVDLARAFAKSYRRNRNPEVALAPATLRAGQPLALVASWTGEDAESYVYFDRATQSLTVRREWMRVSWFADAGAFDEDHDGRAEDDPSTSVSNGFTPPAAGTTVHVWVVLRDARGGVGWTTRAFVVAP